MFWLDYYGLSLQMRKSTDQGVTFSDPIAVAKLEKHSHAADLGLTDSNGNIFRADSAPQAVINPATGDIYLIYADKPKNAKDRADIFFVQSTDGGQTWTTRRRVNDDATTSDQWQPALAITPDGSHVGIFWYDRRFDPGNNLIDRYASIGSVSGSTVTFGPNFRVTRVSFPPAFGQDTDVNSQYMGDYDQAVADNNFFYTTWGDNRLANPNYRAHVNQPDVRFAKIPIDWIGTVSTLAGSILSASSAGVLSSAVPGPSASLAWETQGAEHTSSLLRDATNSWPGTAPDVFDWPSVSRQIASLSNACTHGSEGDSNRIDLLTQLGQKDEDEDLLAEARTAGARHASWSGTDPFDLAALDRLFADSETSALVEGGFFQAMLRLAKQP